MLKSHTEYRNFFSSHLLALKVKPQPKFTSSVWTSIPRIFSYHNNVIPINTPHITDSTNFENMPMSTENVCANGDRFRLHYVYFRYQPQTTIVRRSSKSLRICSSLVKWNQKEYKFLHDFHLYFNHLYGELTGWGNSIPSQHRTLNLITLSRD